MVPLCGAALSVTAGRRRTREPEEEGEPPQVATKYQSRREKSLHKNLQCEIVKEESDEHLLPGRNVEKKVRLEGLRGKTWWREKEREREAGRVSLGVGVERMRM